MKICTVALILGVSVLFLGLIGFVPGFTFISGIISHLASVYSEPGYGYVFGVFPINSSHNAIRILVGLWGIAAYTSLCGAIAFLQVFTVLYGAEAILGLFSFSNTLFGLVPIFGGNVGLNFLTAAIAAHFGFVKPGLLTKGTGLTANSQ